MERLEKRVYLYIEIYQQILEKIQIGFYDDTFTLPSEAELQKEYSVSRVTVRRALKELEHDGYIQTGRGVPARLLPTKTTSSLDGVKGFSSSIETSGERPSSIILDFSYKQANEYICQQLKLPVFSFVYILKRLRLRNGRIIGLHITYIQPDIGKRISESELNENTSIYNLYEEMGIKIASADEIIEVKIPSKDVQKDLFLKNNAPIVYRERITYDIHNRPIEYSENSYRADGYRYTIHLTSDNKK